MLIPDLEIGRRFVDSNKPRGRILLCAVTGSHHYGFPSRDSDLDLKGIHMAPTGDLLGLTEPEQTRDRLEIFENVECDYTSHEVKKALKLLLSGNGNMLERILSPYQLLKDDGLEELRQLAKDSLSKRSFCHYRGYFKGMCAEHERGLEPVAKSLLYSYRVALTGIHLLRTGELEANLSRTSKVYGFDDIIELIEFKRDHGEKSALTPELDIRHKMRWPDLEALLNESLETSKLPDHPPNETAVSDWLVKRRAIEFKTSFDQLFC